MSNVTEHLEEKGIEFEVLPHEPTETTMQEAHVLGLDAHQCIKTVVLDLRTGHAFAVVPGDRHVDLDLVKAAINSRHVKLATEEEIERDYPEFELGAVPPLGAFARTPLIVDPEVLEMEEIVIAAGRKDESVKCSPRDLFGDSQMRVAPICG